MRKMILGASMMAAFAVSVLPASLGQSGADKVISGYCDNHTDAGLQRLALQPRELVGFPVPGLLRDPPRRDRVHHAGRRVGLHRR